MENMLRYFRLTSLCEHRAKVLLTNTIFLLSLSSYPEMILMPGFSKHVFSSNLKNCITLKHRQRDKPRQAGKILPQETCLKTFILFSECVTTLTRC